MQIYLVGGAVRDRLLGLDVTEFDWVVVGATPDMLLAAGFKQVGRDFPVFLHPTTGDEYALARTERKSGFGYTGFICQASPDITLEQDLLRRDLTINAIAEDQQGQLYDPFSGRQDLEQRILRHVSPAFSEDPLRILRIARFAARYASLGFTIAEETRQLMSQMVNEGQINHLTAERVWKETEKALLTDSPEVYFQVLYECGAMAVLFPELSKSFTSTTQHPVHALMALKAAAQLSQEVIIRFSALYCAAYSRQASTTRQQINLLAQRLRLPVEIRDLLWLAVSSITPLMNALQLDAFAIIALFNHIDIWRKPHHLSQLLLIAKANACDEQGMPPAHWPQSNYLIEALALTNEVTASEVISDGFTGIGIRDELNQRRIHVLSDRRIDMLNRDGQA